MMPMGAIVTFCLLFRLASLGLSATVLGDPETGQKTKCCLSGQVITCPPKKTYSLVDYLLNKVPELPVLQQLRRRIVLEENAWDSHYISTAALSILLHEYLGYDVYFNAPKGPTKRIFQRISFATMDYNAAMKNFKDDEHTNDGKVLKDAMKEQMYNGMPFDYLNVEVWVAGKEKEFEKTVIREKTVLSAGSIGYNGKSGWYVPSWFAERQMDFFKFLEPPPSDLVDKIANFSQNVLPFCQELKAGATSLTYENPNGPNKKVCYDVEQSADCDIWCSPNGTQYPSMRVETLPGYDVGLQESIIRNNHFMAALFFHRNNTFFQQIIEQKLSYAESVVSAMNGSLDELHDSYNPTAFSELLGNTFLIFYHWEPTAFINDLQSRVAGYLTHDQHISGRPDLRIARMFLPGSNCGSMESNNFRCDFPGITLGKMTSTKITTEAPLAGKLVNGFAIRHDSSSSSATAPYKGGGINMLLYRLGQAQKEMVHDDAIWEVACNWTLANREHLTQLAVRELLPPYADTVKLQSFSFSIVIFFFSGLLIMRLVEFFGKKDSTFYKLSDTPCMIQFNIAEYTDPEQIDNDLTLEFTVPNENQYGDRSVKDEFNVICTRVAWKGNAWNAGVRAGQQLLLVNNAELPTTGIYSNPISAVNYSLSRQGWLRGQLISLYFENKHATDNLCLFSSRGRNSNMTAILKKFQRKKPEKFSAKYGKASNTSTRDEIRVKLMKEREKSQVNENVELRDHHYGQDASSGPADVVMFTSHTVIASESNRRVTVGVFRVGPCTGEIEVGYTTEDGTALAGEDYFPCSDELHFGANDRVKCFDIELSDSALWQPDQYFQVRLLYAHAHRDDPEYKAILSANLQIASVLIVCNDRYPNNLPEEQCENRLKLVWAFIMYCYNIRGKSAFLLSILVLIWGATHNVLIGTIIYNYYFFQCLDSGDTSNLPFFPDCDETALTAYHGLIYVGIFRVVCLAIDRFLAQYGFDGTLGIMMELRAQLVIKYFMLSQRSMTMVADTDMWQLTNAEITEAVMKSWGTLLVVIKEMLTLGMAISVSILFPILNGQTLSWVTLSTANVVLLLLPVNLILVLLYNDKLHWQKILDQERTENHFLAVVGSFDKAKDLSKNYSNGFISSYNLFTQQFCKVDAASMKAIFAAWYMESDLLFASTFAMQMIVLGMQVFGGYAYMDKKNFGVGVMTFSSFMTLTFIFSTVASALARIFKAAIDFKHVAQPIGDIARFLNHSTGHLYKMDCINRNLVIMGLVEKSAHDHDSHASSKHEHGDVDIYMAGLVEAVQITAPEYHHMIWQKKHNLKISFCNVSFCYIPEVLIFYKLSGDIPLGGFGIILGDDASGKGTLLQLIAGIITPDAGSLLCPPFLRYVHMPREPYIIEGNLLDNLLLFAPGWVNKQHARDVISALGLPVGEDAEGEDTFADQLTSHKQEFQDIHKSTIRQDMRAYDRTLATALKKGGPKKEKKTSLTQATQEMKGSQDSKARSQGDKQPELATSSSTDSVSKKSRAWHQAVHLAKCRGLHLENTLMRSTERKLRMSTSCQFLRDQDLRLVEFGRAILADPEVLLANKSFMNLDPTVRERVLSVLLDWTKGGLKGLLEKIKPKEQKWQGVANSLGQGKRNPWSKESLSSLKAVPEKSPYPIWMTRDGDVKRTLLMSANDEDFFLPDADFVVRLNLDQMKLEVEHITEQEKTPVHATSDAIMPIEEEERESVSRRQYRNDDVDFTRYESHNNGEPDPETRMRQSNGALRAPKADGRAPFGKVYSEHTRPEQYRRNFESSLSDTSPK